MKDATKQIEWLEAMRELNGAKKAEKLKLITMKSGGNYFCRFCNSLSPT